MTSQPKHADHAFVTNGEPLSFVFVIDHWQGVTAGLLKCLRCKTHALVYLLGWEEPRLTRRAFALSIVPAEVATIYLRNMNSDFCDLERHRMETEALVSACEPANTVIYCVDNVAIASEKRTKLPYYQPWQSISAAQHEQWFQRTQ